MVKRCIDCGSTTNGAVMVGQVEAGSGPGAILYACIDHARVRARQSTAPGWLPAAVAEFEAQEAEQADGRDETAC